MKTNRLIKFINSKKEYRYIAYFLFAISTYIGAIELYQILTLKDKPVMFDNRVYVLDIIKSEVTGDDIEDFIFLEGNKPNGVDNPFYEQINVVVQNGVTNNLYKISPKVAIGYNPTVFSGDFNGDNINDIMISIESGGSGGYSFNYIYSFIDNNPDILFDYENYNEELRFEVKYQDKYKINIFNKNLNKYYKIDLSNKDSLYLDKIYDENGVLKQELIGNVGYLSKLYPVDYDGDGVYEIHALQRITGIHNADGLGIMETLLKWNNNNFTPYAQNITKYRVEINLLDSTIFDIE